MGEDFASQDAFILFYSACNRHIPELGNLVIVSGEALAAGKLVAAVNGAIPAVSAFPLTCASVGFGRRLTRPDLGVYVDDDAAFYLSIEDLLAEGRYFGEGGWLGHGVKFL